MIYLEAVFCKYNYGNETDRSKNKWPRVDSKEARVYYLRYNRL